MKFSRIIALLCVVAMMASLVACSGTTEAPATVAESQAPANTVPESNGTADTPNAAAPGAAIRLVNGKIEIDTQLKAFAEDYKARTGQEVIIESLGGGVDISAQITNYHASGNMPDMFVINSNEEEKFRELFADLSNEPWVAETDAYLADANGKVIGAPYAVEGVGLIYNADVLAKAGIDPDTLININAQHAAFEKIDGLKAELGLQAVAAVAAESGQMYWSTGSHIMSAYFSMGVERDDKTLINDFNAGIVNPERFAQFAEYVKLLFDYADPSVLISGTYDDQLALFAQGKTAFLTQGNWIDPSLPGYNATFDCGLLPYAFLETDTPGITADAPTWWAVYNGGNVEASKAFLTDITISDAGQKMFVEDAGAISAYKTCKYQPSTPVSANMFKKMQSGPTYAWDWSNMAVGIAQNTLAPLFELYAKGTIDKTQFVDMTVTAVADFIAAQ